MTSEFEKSPIALLNDIRKDAVYECASDQGPTPEERFTFKLMIDGKTFFGSGPSKKEAKAASAVKALRHPAVNVNANRYISKEGQKQNFHGSKEGQKQNFHGNREGQKQNFHGSKQASFDKKPKKEYQVNISPQVPLNVSLTWLQFCDYFRNNCCQYMDCKFLHVSESDEEFYVANRRIPTHIVEQAVLKALAADQTPGISPCKRYMEGQCSRNSCIYRHISRRNFSQEVIEILYKHFEKKFMPREEYHMNSLRHLGSPGLDRVPAQGMSYENRYQNMANYGYLKSPSSDPDNLLKGMRNLMTDNYYRKENELHDLRDELSMLHKENATLKNSYKLRMTESQRMESEELYQEHIRRLRKENVDIRRMLLTEEEKRQQPFYSISNTGHSEDFCFDMIPGMRQQYPEMSRSDSGIRRMENQIRYTHLGIPTSIPTQHSQVHKQVMQQFAIQRQQQTPVYNASRMTSKTTQPQKRPTYNVNQKSNIAQPKKANQQPGRPQKEQPNQKSFLPKKESTQKKNYNPAVKTAQHRRKANYHLNKKSNIAQPKKANQKPSPPPKEQRNQKKESKQKKNDSCKDNPAVKIVNTNHESPAKEQSELESKKDLGVKTSLADEKTPANENVKDKESAADGNLEHQEKQCDEEIKDSDVEIEESDEEMKESDEESDEEIKESDEEIKESDEQIKERESLDQDDNSTYEECDISLETADAAKVKSDISLETADAAKVKSDISLETADAAKVKSDISLETADAAKVKSDISLETADAAKAKSDISLETADAAKVKSDISQETTDAAK